jgi:nickel-dependent lactate racemase
MTNVVKLPQYAWFEPREVPYNLPDGWQVTVYNIAGFNRPVMKPSEIKATITSPTGMPPLREYARDKREVVILFDDLTRCTQTSEMAVFVLEELAAAGIKEDNIRFIAAVANHHALTRIDLVKKLGEDIVSRFPVYNHCPFLNCRDIGTTSYGTKASVNAEVMYCDLKIAIGQIVPHPIYGLSGGGKMIMPGVSSYESVRQHHGPSHQAWRENRMAHGLLASDVIDGNPWHADALEIAKMAGLDMVVNALINRVGETVAVYAGSLEKAYHEGVKAAKTHYVAVNTRDNDIVVANNFVKASEFMVPLGAGARAVKKEGGSVVVIDNSPSGQVVHYLFDNFGKSIAGGLFNPIMVPPNIKPIIYIEYPEGRLPGRFAKPEDVVITSKWDEVISTLEKRHGQNAKVAVYPNADTQIYKD